MPSTIWQLTGRFTIALYVAKPVQSVYLKTRMLTAEAMFRWRSVKGGLMRDAKLYAFQFVTAQET